MKSRADTRTMHVCVGIVDRLIASMLSFEKRLTQSTNTKPTIHCAILWNYGGGGQTQLKGCLSIILELGFTESAWCNKHPSRSGACTNYLGATRSRPLMGAPSLWQRSRISPTRDHSTHLFSQSLLTHRWLMNCTLSAVRAGADAFEAG
jgi:hypothetical protein